MLLYDWKKILRHSGSSSKRVLLVFESMLQQHIPVSRDDPTYRYYYIDFTGHSFLVDPWQLLLHKNEYTNKELAEYIGLASFRNLGEYKATGKLTLDLAHSPIRQDAINKNRLLRIDDSEIHFLYEDYTGDKK